MRRLVTILTSVLMVMSLLPAGIVFAADAGEGVAINAENFPDGNFREYVLENYDTNEDEVLSDTEIMKATMLFHNSEQNVDYDNNEGVKSEITSVTFNDNILDIRFKEVPDADHCTVWFFGYSSYPDEPTFEMFNEWGEKDSFTRDISTWMDITDNLTTTIDGNIIIWNDEGEIVGYIYDLKIDLKEGSCDYEIITDRNAFGSLKGIEYLTNLKVLQISGNKMMEIDLTKNTKLESADLSYTEAKAINLPKMPSEFDDLCAHKANPDVKVYVNGEYLEETEIPSPKCIANNYVTYTGKSYTAKNFFSYDADKVTVVDDKAGKDVNEYWPKAKCKDGYYFDNGAYSTFMLYCIAKASQTPVVSTKAKSVSYKKLKKKAQSTSAVAVTGAKTTKAYKKVSGSKKLTINSSTGKITVKKGTKKGTYTIKVKVTCKSTNNYKAGASTAKTIKVKVK